MAITFLSEKSELQIFCMCFSEFFKNEAKHASCALIMTSLKSPRFFLLS